MELQYHVLAKDWPEFLNFPARWMSPTCSISQSVPRVFTKTLLQHPADDNLSHWSGLVFISAALSYSVSILRSCFPQILFLQHDSRWSQFTNKLLIKEATARALRSHLACSNPPFCPRNGWMLPRFALLQILHDCVITLLQILHYCIIALLHYCKPYADFGSSTFDLPQEAPEAPETLKYIWGRKNRQELYFPRILPISHVLSGTWIFYTILRGQ